VVTITNQAETTLYTVAIDPSQNVACTGSCSDSVPLTLEIRFKLEADPLLAVASPVAWVPLYEIKSIPVLKVVKATTPTTYDATINSILMRTQFVSNFDTWTTDATYNWLKRGDAGTSWGLTTTYTCTMKTVEQSMTGYTNADYCTNTFALDATDTNLIKMVNYS